MSRVITAHYLQRRGAEGTGTNETVRDTAASPVMCCVMCYVLCDVLCVLYVFILDVLCKLYVLHYMCYVSCVSHRVSRDSSVA